MGGFQNADKQLGRDPGDHIHDPVNPKHATAVLVGDFRLYPSLDHREAARDAEARHEPHRGPRVWIHPHHVRERSGRARGSEHGKSPRVADHANEPRSPPAADEKTNEMSGPQHADLLGGKPLLQAGKSIKGREPARAELHERNRKEERSK